MSEAAFHELFPLGEDATPYRKLTGDHVATGQFDGIAAVDLSEPRVAASGALVSRPASCIFSRTVFLKRCCFSAPAR